MGRFIWIWGAGFKAGERENEKLHVGGVVRAKYSGETRQELGSGVSGIKGEFSGTR